MAANERGANELVLSEGEFAYTQDTTKGSTNVHTGPTVVNITGQEHPVIFDRATRRFTRVALEVAAQLQPLTPIGTALQTVGMRALNGLSSSAASTNGVARS